MVIVQLNCSVWLLLEFETDTQLVLVLLVCPSLDMFIMADAEFMSTTVLVSVTLNASVITFVVPSEGESEPVFTQVIAGASFPIVTVVENVSVEAPDVSRITGVKIITIVAK